MSVETFFFWVLPFTLNFILLTWWRYNTEWDDNYTTFPSRGHYLLLLILAAVPIISWFEFVALCVIYCVHRSEDEILLKKNKFNKYWFDVDDED